MFFRIQHETVFRYSERVFIEPLTIRLRPRSDCYQNLIDYHLEVDPEPKGFSESIDLDGNTVACVWSTGLVDSLTIRATSTVKTIQTNPFNFILTDENLLKLPAVYSPYYRKALDPYLERDYTDEDVVNLAEQVLKGYGPNTVSFLSGLNQHIYQNYERIVRKEGEPLNPSELLKKQKGSCRDLAVLFIDVCRSLGLASRFVSGYYYGDQENFDHELHAWVEVYLPGGGWRGFDPTLGLAVTSHHIAVASGVQPTLTAPTFGMFRGTGVDSSLHYNVKIIKSDTRDGLPPIQGNTQLFPDKPFSSKAS